MATDNYKSLDFYTSRIGQIKDGFSKFNEKENFYFTYNKNGRVYLISEDYTTEKGRDNGIESVKKNMKDNTRFVKKSNNSGKHFFSLRAGNNQEIARSTYFNSANDLDAAISGISTGSWITSDSVKGAAGAAAAAGAVTKLSSDKKYEKKDKPVERTEKKVHKVEKKVERKIEKKVEKKVERKIEKAAATSSSSGSTRKATERTVRGADVKTSGGGFKWWWLLPFLLIPILFFGLRSCGACGDAGAAAGAMKDKVSETASNVADKVDETATAAATAAADAARQAEEAAAKLAADTKLKADQAARAAKEEAQRQANYFNGNKSTGY